MSELDEKLSRLEETVSKLADVVEKLAERIEQRNEPQPELKNAEINLSAMRVIVQQSRKGVALRIKFARFIKANNRGEYYIALTPDEYRNLIAGLQSYLNGINGQTANGKNANGNKPKVKVESGFKP